MLLLEAGGWRLRLFLPTRVVLSEAEAPQQVDAVGRGHVQVDVLEVEHDGEPQRPLQVPGLGGR